MYFRRGFRSRRQWRGFRRVAILFRRRYNAGAAAINDFADAARRWPARRASGHCRGGGFDSRPRFGM
jgi:hypothetical protein